MTDITQQQPTSPDVKAALLFALWHHQGGSSKIGQPIRAALGIGAHAHMTPDQLATAVRVQLALIAQPVDPLDWPLPCDVTVGHGTMTKGVKLRTLVMRMKALYELATGEKADAVAGRTTAARDVLAERQRQITIEGRSLEHDDTNRSGQLARAASSYARHAGFSLETGKWMVAQPREWPWSPSWWKPSDPRRNLVKAGALILAEIERLDRAAINAKGSI